MGDARLAPLAFPGGTDGRRTDSPTNDERMDAHLKRIEAMVFERLYRKEAARLAAEQGNEQEEGKRCDGH